VKREIIWIFVVFFLIISLTSPVSLKAAPYYQDKVLALVVCSAPGGGYDRMARLFARYLGKYIPGNPTVIVQNMPGAGGIIAANYLYNIARPNGLSIGLMMKPIAYSQLLKVKGVRFDVTKFPWLGSSSVESTVFNISSELPYKTFNDLVKAKEVIYIGGSGIRHIGTLFCKMLKAFTRLNAKMVEYRTSSEVWLAMERKEVVAAAHSYNSSRPQIESGLIRTILRNRISQIGIEHVPVNEDFANDPIGKKIMAMHAIGGKAGKSFAAPPGTPAKLMKILREAFANAARSSELQADAKKTLMEVTYVSPKEILGVMNEIFSQPPEIVKEFSKYVK